MEVIKTKADIENFKKLLDKIKPIQRFCDPSMLAEGYDNLQIYIEKLDLIINVKLVINKE